jgi:hypothetical protein
MTSGPDSFLLHAAGPQRGRPAQPRVARLGERTRGRDASEFLGPRRGHLIGILHITLGDPVGVQIPLSPIPWVRTKRATQGCDSSPLSGSGAGSHTNPKRKRGRIAKVACIFWKLAMERLLQFSLACASG